MGSPLERDRRLCEYLGKVTARWGQMEEVLALFLGDVLESEAMGKVIYFATGSFRQRIEIIKAAIDERFVGEEDFKSCTALLNRINKAFQVRNHLVHSHYVLVVENPDGEQSYLNQYFDDEIDLQPENLKALYIGRLSDGDVVRVNAGTFSNHGEKVDDLMISVLDFRDQIASGQVELGSIRGD